MSEDEMDDAIAEIVGWRPTGPSWYVDKYDRPKYSRDLNTMHGVEKTMTDGQYDTFEQELARVVGFKCHDEWPGPSSLRLVISADAPQRAEAFLRTFNKWKD